MAKRKKHFKFKIPLFKDYVNFFTRHFGKNFGVAVMGVIVIAIYLVIDKLPKLYADSYSITVAFIWLQGIFTIFILLTFLREIFNKYPRYKTLKKKSVKAILTIVVVSAIVVQTVFLVTLGNPYIEQSDTKVGTAQQGVVYLTYSSQNKLYPSVKNKIYSAVSVYNQSHKDPVVLVDLSEPSNLAGDLTPVNQEAYLFAVDTVSKAGIYQRPYINKDFDKLSTKEIYTLLNSASKENKIHNLADFLFS